QLLAQPVLVPAAGGQIAVDDPPVVDDDHGQCHVILQPQSQLFRRGRLLGCPGKDGQLAG
ncbi:hypothetical protein BBBGCB_BBBGCB_16685, partial [Dysosmobacter welbionis]